MLHSDSYFWIGKNKPICQDYTLHKSSYVILSDGCSSSKDVDFGARLLVKSAEKFLNYLPLESFGSLVIQHANDMRMALGLSCYSLDATLLVAAVNRAYIDIKIFGDGVIVFSYPHCLEVIEISYDSGAPYYLNYLLDEPRSDLYKKEFGFELTKKLYTISNDTTNKPYIYKDSAGMASVRREISGLRSVSIMSDGVMSFRKTIETDTSKAQEHVPTEKVLERLLAYKNYGGIFVERRALKFRRDMLDLGWHNYDDVSVGTIYLENVL